MPQADKIVQGPPGQLAREAGLDNELASRHAPARGRDLDRGPETLRGQATTTGSSVAA